MKKAMEYCDIKSKTLLFGWIITMFMFFIHAIFQKLNISILIGEAEGWPIVRNIIAYIVISILLICLLKEFLKNNCLLFKRESRKTILQWIIRGTIGVVLAQLIGAFILSFCSLKPLVSDNQQMADSLMALFPFWVCLITIVGGPFVEELIFRGIMFHTLKKINLPFAIIVSSFAFSFWHVYVYFFTNSLSFSLLYMVRYGLAGVALAWIYCKRKNIIVNMICHSIWNMICCLGILAKLNV